MKTRSIALDGPAGAGKSAVADDVAKALGILHLDTGAMYRAFTYRALAEGLSTEDEQAMASLAQRVSIGVKYVDGRQLTSVDGEDVTDRIRTPEISMGTSNSSKFAAVRRLMVRLQQELAKQQSMILDGRDIGTKVLPDATLKVYLTASPEERAKRRWLDLRRKDPSAEYEDVLADVIKRDQQDMSREVSPLKPADDAVILDNTELTQAETVEAILKLLEARA